LKKQKFFVGREKFLAQRRQDAKNSKKSSVSLRIRENFLKKLCGLAALREKKTSPSSMFLKKKLSVFIGVYPWGFIYRVSLFIFHGNAKLRMFRIGTDFAFCVGNYE